LSRRLSDLKIDTELDEFILIFEGHLRKEEGWKPWRLVELLVGNKYLSSAW